MRRTHRHSKRMDAANQFTDWRNQGYPMHITKGQAYVLTDGKIGEKNSNEMTTLAAVAFRYHVTGK